jgi:hypothetical protein
LIEGRHAERLRDGGLTGCLADIATYLFQASLRPCLRKPKSSHAKNIRFQVFIPGSSL